MKTRYGFVSNSSTTSFLIYGAQIPTDKEEEARKLELKTYYLNPEAYYEEEDSRCCAGLSWDCVGDNETGKQFKERVEAMIKQIDENIECCTIEEAYYNS